MKKKDKTRADKTIIAALRSIYRAGFYDGELRGLDYAYKHMRKRK